jgi:2-polyprenyl-3-methyl-5-hydroxy-6-metoxy-1,4-benzoquinol methylase
MGRELLDRPDVESAVAAASYRFMRLVNRWFGGTRPVKRFLEREARMPGAPRPLRVLEVGAGDCSMAIALSRRLRRRGLDVRFTCVDSCDYAAEAARRALARARDDRLEFRHGDVFALEPGERCDCAVASMFLHHFPDDRVVEAVTGIRALVRGSVLINDLERSLLNLAGCWILSRGWPRAVQHDGLLSVRRGFRAAELERLLADLPRSRVEVRTMFPGRIAAAVRPLSEE